MGCITGKKNLTGVGTAFWVLLNYDEVLSFSQLFISSVYMDGKIGL